MRKPLFTYLALSSQFTEWGALYSKTLSNRRLGANNERGGVALVVFFGGPGDGFLVLVTVVACHYFSYH